MPVYFLGDEGGFPPVERAEDGLLAIGGDLSAERLIEAYAGGIFPWYSEGQPILWHAPDPRFVLTPETFRVPRSVARRVRSSPFRLTMDTRFRDVIHACAVIRRPDQDGTWITPEMERAYEELHRRGLAHSVEAWEGERLVGGIYGISLGAGFFGESMFSRASDASKVAFVALFEQLVRWGITLIDCQVFTDHMARFGAEEWPREKFMARLGRALEVPTRAGVWSFDGGEHR